jgi:hypothetical protein
MTMKLSDLISVQRTQSAIELTSGLGERGLVATFMPTDAAISILRKIERAVQPDANMQDRALNWFGTYGAGKSRLAVLVGQMLRDGASGPEFTQFLGRLANVNQSRLASALKNTFLPPDDEDARPYFVVPIYGNRAGSIQEALVEALYRAIVDSKLFAPDEILPKTTFDVAAQRNGHGARIAGPRPPAGTRIRFAVQRHGRTKDRIAATRVYCTRNFQ